MFHSERRLLNIGWVTNIETAPRGVVNEHPAAPNSALSMLRELRHQPANGPVPATLLAVPLPEYGKASELLSSLGRGHCFLFFGWGGVGMAGVDTDPLQHLLHDSATATTNR